jgi:hypothetical protein
MGWVCTAQFSTLLLTLGTLSLEESSDEKPLIDQDDLYCFNFWYLSAFLKKKGFKIVFADLLYCKFSFLGFRQ